MTRWEHLFEADARIEALKREWVRTGDEAAGAAYARAMDRANILKRLNRRESGRMQALFAYAPLTWRPIDDSLQKKGWVEVYDEKWRDYDTKKSATITDLAIEHYYKRNGSVNNIWLEDSAQ